MDKSENAQSSSSANVCNTAKNQWMVVGAAAIGRSHLSSNPPIPCQDNYLNQEIGNGWGISVVSDGAGSATNSHWGSEFVVQNATALFRQVVEKNDWHRRNILPSQKDWHEAAKLVFAQIVANLGTYAQDKGVNVGTLACTAIVAVYSPIGILITHVGDGRAGCCNESGEWNAMIKPWRGQEANVTVFLTSPIWDEPDEYVESKVINEKLIAFTLMSDGCEMHAFETGLFDEKLQRYIELNRPFLKFFQPLVTTLKKLHQDGTPYEEIMAKWRGFIESGNEGLKNETDDKTMVLGVVLD